MTDRSTASSHCSGQPHLDALMTPNVGDDGASKSCAGGDCPASFGDSENSATSLPKLRVAYRDDFAQRALCDRDLRVDMAEADVEARKFSAQWSDWSAVRLRALSFAYPIYIFLLHDDEAFETIIGHPHYNSARSGRKRQPSKKKPWILALEFVMRPCSESQRKDVSEWANLLQYALLKKIAPCDFLEDIAEVPISEAKATVRSHRKQFRSECNAVVEGLHMASNEGMLEPSIKENGSSVEVLTFVDNSMTRGDLRIAIDPSMLEAFDRYLASRDERKALHEVLLDLAAIAEPNHSGLV